MSASTSREVCCYERHACSRPRYQEYKYCAQHVLEDSSSPFTSCEYISRSSGRKCPKPALRSNKGISLPVFCDEHLHDLIVKEQHQKKKRKLRKKRKNLIPQKKNPALAKRVKLVNQLSKYTGDDDTKPNDDPDSSDQELEEVHRPVKDHWLLDNSDGFANEADWDDFDLVNNEVYEPLRYADVLTPEEVVATAQSKLIRLQSLYIEQFKRLFHLLKERRQQYLHERKREMKEERAGTSRSQDDDLSLDEDEIYALATYRKRTGLEALLRKRQLKRRQQSDANTSNSAVKSLPASRCSYISNHARCKGSCLPYTKYCTSHILEDPHQELYRKCHTVGCATPVCFLSALRFEIKTSDDAQTEEVCYCCLHAPLPEMKLEFHENKTGNEEMDVDIEGPLDNLPGSQDTELASQPVEDTMEIDSIVIPSKEQEFVLQQGKEDRPPEEGVNDEEKETGNVQATRASDDVSDFSATQPVAQSLLESSDSISSTLPIANILTDSIPAQTSLTDSDISNVQPAQSLPENLSDNVLSAVPKTESTVDPQSQSMASLPPGLLRTTGTAESVTIVTNLQSAQPETKKASDSSLEQGVHEVDAVPVLQTSPSTIQDESLPQSDVPMPESQGKGDPSRYNVATPPPEAKDLESDAAEPNEHVSAKTPSDITEPHLLRDLPESSAQDSEEELLLDPVTGLMHRKKEGLQNTEDDAQTGAVECTSRESTYGVTSTTSTNANNNCRTETSCNPDDKNRTAQPVVTTYASTQMPQMYVSHRGERKPSSAEEEMAVVSLLALCSGHHSDDNTPSSSTEQE